MKFDLRKHSLSRRLALAGALAITMAAVSVQAMAHPNHRAKGRTLAVRFLGTATMVALPWDKWPQMVKNSGLPSDTECFKVPMYDVTGSIRRGTGYNCLSYPHQIGIADGVSVRNTVFFRMPGGTIVSSGDIIAQPMFADGAAIDPIGSKGELPYLVGGLPSDNRVVRSTRGFKRWGGRVRLSGFVDLSNLTGGEMRMDVIYLIDLHKKKRRTR